MLRSIFALLYFGLKAHSTLRFPSIEPAAAAAAASAGGGGGGGGGGHYYATFRYKIRRRK